MFVNTLTADDKYSLLNRDNLRQPIWTPLSQKHKAFSQFFLTFSKSTLRQILNAIISKTQDDPQS